MKKYTLCLTLFIFVINSFLAIPLVLFSIYNKRNFAYFFLIIILGLLSFLWLPSGDIYRIQNDFELLKSFSFFEIYSFNIDFIYSYLLYFVGKVGLDFAYLRFIVSCFSHALLFYVLRTIVSLNSNLNNSKFMSFHTFLIFFFFLRFGVIITGVRFTLAFSIFLYGYYILFYLKRKFGLFCLFLAAFTHFSFVLLLFILFINIFIKSYLNIFLFSVLLIIGFIYSSTLIQNIIEFLPLDDNIKLHLSNYTVGYYAVEEFQTKSLFFKISRLLSYMVIYPALLFIIVTRKNFKNYSTFLILIIFLAIQWNMNTSFSRYAYISIFLFLIEFLRNYEYNKKYFFLVLLFFSVVSYTSSIYLVRKELFYGHQYKLLFYPTPFVLFNTYDKIWLENNIMSNGDLKKLKTNE